MFSLHTHSYYSMLRGTLSPVKLVELAKKTGSKYAVLTDKNGMYGLIQFAKKCLEEGIKPILGVEIDDPKNNNESAIFIAKNNEGYSSICKLITSRKLSDSFSLANAIKHQVSGVFIISSSIELLKKILFVELIRKKLFVELFVTEKLKGRTKELYNFAKQNNVKMVVTNPTYFAEADEFLLHKVLTAIRENSTLENIDETLLEDEEFYFKPSDDLLELWKALPSAINNCNYIADNCNVDLKLGISKFPEFLLPHGESAFSYLWKICFENLARLYKPITDKAMKRLQSELEVIADMGFCDYFLVVWDIVHEAQKRNMMNIGRGSAANSLVAYCLGLSQVDPLKHNFYFERFMNRGRTSPPDIDLDFSWKERDDIVKYVFEKYGYDRVAMISTTVTFRARSAFRETAKVFGISENEISKYSKYIPWTSANNLPYLAEKFPESKSLKFDTEPWATIINIASKLAGFPRHLSIHPGGIVITKHPITNYVALEHAKNKGLGLIVTQPDMYPIEDFGLIKIDLLSQRSLGVLRDTIDMINIIGQKVDNKGKIPIVRISN